LSIKIGIELSYGRLRSDLLTHPERYFLSWWRTGRPSFAFEPAIVRGNMEAHIIDGLAPDKDGNLVSVFEEGIRDAVLELRDRKRSSYEGDEYPISSYLARMICQMADLTDWIVSSILTNGKNLVLFSTWETEISKENWEY